jgi:hypothetical protein
MLKNVCRLALIVLLAGCDERERFTLPTDGSGTDEEGPISDIDIPARDTVLTAGVPFIVGGRSTDASGVDTVYFAIAGGDVNFAPLPGDGADTVRFGLTLPTFGLSGTIITVTVRGVDVHGNRGAPVFRQLNIE